jgi:ribosomal protein S18 acetylase RimI-like enzyme
MSKSPTNYTIEQVRQSEWTEAAELVARSVPNALISKLGNKFGATFYSKLVEQECSCGYVARDEAKNILGVVIGTTNYPQASSIALKSQLAKLAIKANFRLMKWAVVAWAVKGIISRLKSETQNSTARPEAELVAIAVRPEMRGTGLAMALVDEMERFMASQELGGTYSILTEKANKRANRFYEKIGAKLVRTDIHHGREINEWHKEIDIRSQNE